MAYKFKTSKERSALMKKIKSDKTAPETVFQKALRSKRVKYLKNYKKLTGNPYIGIKRNKIAVFVDGEFWHGYRWKEKKRKIKANRAYWIPKIERNIARDKQANRKLRKEGWLVLRFWEKDIKKDLKKCVQKTIEAKNSR